MENYEKPKGKYKKTRINKEKEIETNAGAESEELKSKE